MDLNQIKPYAKNAKRHNEKQIQQIANSIKQFGFNQPIVIDSNNTIIVGHGRYEAAKILGLTDVPTIQVNLTEDQAKAYRLADNKLNESEFNLSLVIEEMQGLTDDLIELTGFDRELLDSGVFNPNLNPIGEYSGVTAGQVEKKNEELIEKFRQEPVMQDVTCPHCGKDFKIN